MIFAGDEGNGWRYREEEMSKARQKKFYTEIKQIEAGNGREPFEDILKRYLGGVGPVCSGMEDAFEVSKCSAMTRWIGLSFSVLSSSTGRACNKRFDLYRDGYGRINCDNSNTVEL